MLHGLDVHALGDLLNLPIAGILKVASCGVTDERGSTRENLQM